MIRASVVAASAFLMVALASAGMARAAKPDNLGVMTTSGAIGQTVKVGQQFWVVAVVCRPNPTGLESWVLSLDGVQVSYGQWAIPSGGCGLFTSINSQTFGAKGDHVLLWSDGYSSAQLSIRAL